MNPNQSSLGRHAATDFKTADDGCGGTGSTEQNEADEKIMQPFLHSSQAQDPSRSSMPIPQQTETYEKARGDSLVKQLFLDLDNSGESPRSSHEKIGNSIQTESGNAPSSTTNRNSSRHRSESFDDINGKGRISHLNIHNQRNYGNITRDGNSFVSNRRSMDPTGMFRNRGRHIVGTNSIMSSTVYSHNTRNVPPSSKPCSSPHHSTIGQATDSIKVSSFSPDRGSLPPSNIAQNSFESSPTAKNSDGSETYSRMVQDEVASLPVSLQSECNHHNYVKSNGKESIRQHLRMTSNNFQLENHEGNQSHSQINFDHDRLREGRDKQICDALDLHSRPQSNLSIDIAQSMTLHQEPKQPVFSSETMLNLNESLIDGESSDNDDEVDRFDNGFIFNCDSTVGDSPEVGSNVRGGTTVAQYGLMPKTSSATNTLDVIDASYDQTNKDDTISNNKSHCRYKSNENDPQSPAGSTVSVMGSVAADEDYSSLDEVRLVQTRLMQDVMEDDEDTRDEDGNIDVIKQEPSSKSSSNKIAQNMSNTVTPKSPATKAWKYHKIQSRYKGIERNSSLPNVQGGINAPGVDNGNTNTVTLDEPITTNNLPLPFQLARKCFSFEDTTTDDNYFLSTPHQFQIRKGASRSAQYQSYGLSAVASYPSDFENSQSATDNNVDDNARDTIFKPVKRVLPHPKWHPPDRARLIQVNKNSPFRDISRSQTWDNHKSSPPRPYKCSHHASLDGARRVASFDDYSLPPNMKLMRQDMIELGSKFMNTLSTDIAVKCSDLTSNDRDFPEKDIQFESTLKRVERDRDYAIQLLKEILEAVPLCDNYCEPVEIQPEEVIEGGRYNSSNASTSIRDLICDLCKTRYDQHRFFTCDECSQKLFTIVTSFKELIVAQDCNIDSNESTSINKSVLPGVLDILMHSYEILKKIINTGGWIGRAKDLIDSFEENHKISSGRCSSITTFHSNGTNGSGNVGQTLGRKSTVSSMKQKAKCIEAKTDISSEVLDQNIFEMVEGFPHQTCDFSDPGKQSFKHSKCLTEKHLECSKQNILLKAALKKANKTIAELQRRCYMFEQNVPFESDIDPIPKDPSYNNSEDIFLKIASDLENDSGIAIKIDDPALEKELEEYKEALLRSLDIPTRSAPTAQTSTVSNDMNGSSCQQQHTVNVKMIDSENFITEWSDLVPPLPPPPDHGLRSPIVDTILDQWTDDPETKESLISWMESIIEGANPELVPPLKLSGLSHQIRDGFVMHVLPLLLLRKDHHVHVASRAQRQTSYDIAVSISKTSTGMDFISSTDLEHSRLHKSNLGKHHNMAYRASSSIQNHDSGGERPEPHDEMISSMPFDRPNMPGSPKIGFNSKNSDAGSISTAITSPISNRAPSKKSILLSRGKPSKPSQISSRGGSVSYYSHGHESESLPSIPATCASLGDDLSASSASECDGENNRQKGKETIWGAFGGLLHRRKFIHSKLQNQNLNGMRSCLLDQMTTPSQEAIPFSFYSPADQEPHHRVVSAPPGKIGLTFVEHRGHTMVSSVSEGSPLTGFVFQGDILIAIDETPVSGLRTKEIVKLLTAMKDKHRALRMMSSHGMNELISPMSY